MVIPSLEDFKTLAAQANLTLFMKKSILTGRGPATAFRMSYD